MNKWIQSVLICLSLGTTLSHAQFQTTAPASRIAVVDARKIINDSMTSRALQAKRQSDFSTRENDLRTQAATLNEKTTQFEKSTDKLTEVQKSSARQQLAELTKDLRRKQQQYKDDRDARKRADVQQLIVLGRAAVKSIAETEQWDVVLQEPVYANPNNDITEKVIRLMDDQASK